MHNKKSNNSKTYNFLQGLRPFSSSIPRGLKSILKKGSEKANIIAEKNLKNIREKVGLI